MTRCVCAARRAESGAASTNDAKTIEEASTSASARRRLRSPRASHASPRSLPIRPLRRRRSADEQQQHRRHVPQIHLIHHRHAMLAQRDILGERARGGRRVELSARLRRHALEQRRAHLGVEVFRVEIGHAHVARVADRRSPVGSVALDAHRIHARLIGRERAAILAVAVDRPVERQIAREAAVARQMRDDFRIVARNEDAVRDRRANRDRILRIDLVGRQRHDHAARHVARHPAQHLPPEALERLDPRPATLGSICQFHESCTGNAIDSPRPYR